MSTPYPIDCRYRSPGNSSSGARLPARLPSAICPCAPRPHARATISGPARPARWRRAPGWPAWRAGPTRRGGRACHVPPRGWGRRGARPESRGTTGQRTARQGAAAAAWVDGVSRRRGSAMMSTHKPCTKQSCQQQSGTQAHRATPLAWGGKATLFLSPQQLSSSTTCHGTHCLKLSHARPLVPLEPLPLL